MFITNNNKPLLCGGCYFTRRRAAGPPRLMTAHRSVRFAWAI